MRDRSPLKRRTRAQSPDLDPEQFPEVHGNFLVEKEERVSLTTGQGILSVVIAGNSRIRNIFVCVEKYPFESVFRWGYFYACIVASRGTLVDTLPSRLTCSEESIKVSSVVRVNTRLHLRHPCWHSRALLLPNLMHLRMSFSRDNI